MKCNGGAARLKSHPDANQQRVFMQREFDGSGAGKRILSDPQ
jgi:hypothetical protein